MARDLSRIPTWAKNGDFHVVVEVPRSSEVKLKYDPKLKLFRFSRALVLGLRYPFDWGFVPSTLAPDGDPLDAMVLLEASTCPGVVFSCRPLGVVKLEQSKEVGKGRERNDRVIAWPRGSGRAHEVEHVKDLPKQMREELEEFFLAATAFERKNAKILGWSGPKEATQLIREARDAFLKKKK